MSYKFIIFLVLMVLLFPGFFVALLEGVATAIFMIAVASVLIMAINAATDGNGFASPYTDWQ